MDNTQELIEKVKQNFDEIHNVVATEEQVQKIINLIPRRIKNLSEEWGWDDTEVRDFIYVLVRDSI